MKILTIEPNRSSDVLIYMGIIDYTKKQTFNLKTKDNKKLTIKIPNKSNYEDFATGCDVYVVAFDRDAKQYFCEHYFDNEPKISYNLKLNWRTLNYNIKDKYEIKEGEKLKELEYTPNFINKYGHFNDYKINDIKVKIDDNWVTWDGYDGVKEGSYTIRVKLTTRNGLSFEKDVTIVVKPKEDSQELPDIKPISFNYAFFSPINNFYIKPEIPIACFLSKNLELKKVDFIYNDEIVFSTSNIDSIINLDVTKIPSYQDIDIKAKFYCIDKTTGENVVLEDTKQFNISEQLKFSLYHNYDNDKKVFRIGVSATTEAMEAVNKILFNIRFNSVIQEHVVSVGEYSVDSITDVVFEHEIDTENPEITVDFKEASNYTITAYIYDKAGNIHIAKDSIKQLDSSGDKNYSINTKIPVIIKSNSGKVPVFDLYYVNDNGLNKVKTYVCNKLFDNMYSGEFTAENNDCVYITKIENSLKTYYIGDSDNIVVLRVRDINNLPKYEFKDYDGNTVSEGTVTVSDVDNEIGYIILPKDTSGILKIGSNTYKKIG